ncbi:uncharacterized protein LOC111043936 [Nilaparvata lugens]|uniref:uncharacterized protein LOC111043936 n=1 Tax=Nilaparvata lugens TaxID=108931 RepID=UPI00193E4D6F|nr:uncharacterized protein LOC111043936 [Nilaparvata lugens]
MWTSRINYLQILLGVLLLTFGNIEVDATSIDEPSESPPPKSFNELDLNYYKPIMYSRWLTSADMYIKLMTTTFSSRTVRKIVSPTDLDRNFKLRADLSYLVVVKAILFNYFTQNPTHKTVFETAIKKWRDQCFISPKEYEALSPSQIRAKTANIESHSRFNAFDEVIEIERRGMTNYKLLRSAITIEAARYIMIASQPSDRRNILVKFSKYLDNGGIAKVVKKSKLTNDEKNELSKFLVICSALRDEL